MKEFCPGEIHGIDTISGLERFSGDWAVYIKMMGLFVKSQECALDNLVSLIDSEDTEAMAVLAHKIKGAAANLSATTLMVSAIELEKAANEKNIEEMRKRGVATKNSFEALFRTIKNIENTYYGK